MAPKGKIGVPSMAKKQCNATAMQLDNKGRFVTETGGHRLVDRDLGSAVSTFRKVQSLKSKFPAEFWS